MNLFTSVLNSKIYVPDPGPLPALSFQTAYFQAALCADHAVGAPMRTIRRSCMTAGTEYGLAPFVKVQESFGFPYNK